MIKLFYTLCIGLILTSGAHSQIKLIGVSYNTSSSSIDLIQWEAFNSSSVTTTPTNLDAYLYASSSFDPFNSNYYISAVSGQTTGLYSFNTDNGESSLTTGSLYTNIAEFDMSNSKMYNLIMETEEYISIFEYDIESNQDSLIGIIFEPGVIGIVADAIGFDSNNGILYYCGYTSNASLALYAIPVRDESFSFSKTILNTPNPICSITSLNFDNVNEKLFAANDSYDVNGNSTGRSIVEIDMNTGDVNVLGQLSAFPNFVGGSSQFDQNSGNFLLVGINANNETEMIAFDTYTKTYVSGFVPNVTEIVCDNTLFSRSTYMAATLSDASLNFSLYPNPVEDQLNLEWTSNGPVQVQLFNSMGELVYKQNRTTESSMNVDMSALSPGLYIVNLTGNEQTVYKKIVVQ